VLKTEAKKEVNPNKEFVDGIMTEMEFKGDSKKTPYQDVVKSIQFR